MYECIHTHTHTTYILYLHKHTSNNYLYPYPYVGMYIWRSLRTSKRNRRCSRPLGPKKNTATISLDVLNLVLYQEHLAIYRDNLINLVLYRDHLINLVLYRDNLINLVLYRDNLINLVLFKLDKRCPCRHGVDSVESLFLWSSSANESARIYLLWAWCLQVENNCTSSFACKTTQFYFCFNASGFKRWILQDSTVNMLLYSLNMRNYCAFCIYRKIFHSIRYIACMTNIGVDFTWEQTRMHACVEVYADSHRPKITRTHTHTHTHTNTHTHTPRIWSRTWRVSIPLISCPLTRWMMLRKFWIVKTVVPFHLQNHSTTHQSLSNFFPVWFHTSSCRCSANLDVFDINFSGIPMPEHTFL